ncbi:hypothetical protein CHUAL_014130 [Chamberlinius hualienensis]
MDDDKKDKIKLQIRLSDLFSGLNYFNFESRFVDDDETEKICSAIGLVGRKPDETFKPTCKLCNSNLRAECGRGGVLGWRYRCTKADCRKTLSPVLNSCFKKSRLGPYNLIKVMFAFVEDMPHSQAIRHLGIAKQSVTDWYKFCRRVCDDSMIKNSVKIGGPYLHVQVDETQLAKQKYGKNRVLPSEIRKFVFGGKCLETGDKFLIRVANCDRATLWAIMRNRIAAGSKVYTNADPVYDGIADEEGQRFGLDFWDHQAVVYKEEFEYLTEDEENGGCSKEKVSTNLVDKMWRQLKPQILDSSSSEAIDMYISRYCYFVTFLKHLQPGERLRHFLSDVKRVYPGPL